MNRYQLQLEPANAELLVDGARQPTDRPLVLGVGVHHLSVSAAGYNDAQPVLGEPKSGGVR